MFLFKCKCWSWLQLSFSIVTHVTAQFVFNKLNAYAVQPLWAVLLFVLELVKRFRVVLADQVNQLLSKIPLDGDCVLAWAFVHNVNELFIGVDQTVENDQEREQIEVDDNEEKPYQVVDHVVDPHGDAFNIQLSSMSVFFIL